MKVLCNWLYKPEASVVETERKERETFGLHTDHTPGPCWIPRHQGD